MCLILAGEENNKYNAKDNSPDLKNAQHPSLNARVLVAFPFGSKDFVVFSTL